MAVLNFATLARDDRDVPLLTHNPLKGLPYPSEDNPRRPMLADDRYQKMREVADRVHPRCDSFFVVVHETGHRAASVRQLRWSDIDLEAKTVKWRSDTDKIGFAHQTPLSDDAVAILTAERRRRTILNDSWVFPSDRDPSKPLPRHTANKWWRRAENPAKIEHVAGTGFHSARRNFASEMKSTNLRDLAYMGAGIHRRQFSPCISSRKLKCSGSTCRAKEAACCRLTQGQFDTSNRHQVVRRL